MDKTKKEELAAMLNAALALRKQMMKEGDGSQARISAASELLRISMAALKRATEIGHEHGSGLAREMLIAARLFSSEPMDCAEAERELAAVKDAAKSFGDVNLALRALELLAVVHNRTGETWKEARVGELAVAIGGRSVPAVVTLLGAYWRVIEAANISLVQATAAHSEAIKQKRLATLERSAGADDGQADEELESEQQKKLREALLEYNLKFWHELRWLASLSQPQSLNFEEFLRRFKTPAFAVSVYVGTMLADPYVSEWKREDVAESQAAFDLATRVADLTADSDAACVAAAHRVRAYYGRASPSEKAEMVQQLRSLQESKHPTSTDIADLLADIEKQGAAFPSATSQSSEQSRIVQERIAQQLHQFRQLQQRSKEQQDGHE